MQQAQSCGGRRWTRPVPLTVALALAALVSYFAVNTLGRQASIDLVEYYRNYAGGFVAVGVSDDKPGVLILSELERHKTLVRAGQDALRCRSVVLVETPLTRWEQSLWKPQAVLLHKDGTIDAYELASEMDDFNRIRRAVDCAHGSAKRCGAPFAELHDMITHWPDHGLPPAVLQFLSRNGKSVTRRD